MSAILVVYATKNGSTREVAEAIGTVAAAEGAGIEVVPAHAVVGPVTPADLVVLGAPIYSGRWHRDAHRFLKRHRRELAGMPVAVSE
jgi:menaquinone-dependent protoporphyrinogen oxidase